MRNCAVQTTTSSTVLGLRKWTGLKCGMECSRKLHKLDLGSKICKERENCSLLFVQQDERIHYLTSNLSTCRVI